MTTRESAEATLSIRPTLFIGIGGTGDLVVRRIKRLIRESYGDSIKAFRYLVIDLSDLSDPQDEEPLEPQEKCPLEAFDAPGIIENIQNYPAIEQWWPHDPEDPEKFLTPKKLGVGMGAGQDRLMGRLAFSVYYDSNPRGGQSIRSSLERAIGDITRADIITGYGTLQSGLKWEIVGGGSAQVVMVFSLCGGTGGGMFLDIASVCRMLLGQGKKHYVDAYCMMPSVFERHINRISMAERDNLNANTCAAIMDIEALNKNADWKANYKGQKVSQRLPPFDRQFLFELTQTQGVDPGATFNLFDNVAQSIFLSVATAMRRDLDVPRGNTDDKLHLTLEGKQRLFSSLGSASIVYPRERIMDYCCSMMGKDFIQEYLSPDITKFTAEQRGQLEVEGKNSAAQFLQGQRLTPEQIVSVLTRDCVYEVPNSERLINEAQNKQGHKVALSNLTQQKDQDKAQVNTQNEGVKKKAAELRAETFIAVSKRTLNLLESAGFYAAKEFLLALLRDLPESPPRVIYSFPDSRDYLIAEARKQRDKAEEKDKARSIALKKLGSSFLSMPLLTSAEQRQVAISNAIDTFREYYRETVELEAVNLAVSLYASLAEDVERDLLEPLRKFEGKMAVAANLLGENSLRALKGCRLNTANPFARSCINEEYAAQYYMKNKPKDISGTRSNFWSQLKDLSWQDLCEHTLAEEVARLLLEACRPAFVGISGTTVMDVIKEGKTADQARAALDREFTSLQIICHPFLPYNEARAGANPPERKVYIGAASGKDLEDLAAAIGPGRASTYKGVASGLLHRIDNLQELHCVASGTINSWSALENSYQQAINNGKNIRLVIEEETETIRENESAFALSLPYGLITRKGDSYFWNPDKIKEPPRVGFIARGRAQAMVEFARRHSGWAEKGDALINNLIEVDGAEKSIELLNNWCNGLQDQLSGASTDLRDQYTKELKYIQAKIDEIEEKKRTRDRQKSDV